MATARKGCYGADGAEDWSRQSINYGACAFTSPSRTDGYLFCDDNGYADVNYNCHLGGQGYRLWTITPFYLQ